MSGAILRYFVSAIVAALTLLATLFGLSKAVGPGSPAEVLIVGKLELLAAGLSEPHEQPEQARRPPPRPRVEPPSR